MILIVSPSPTIQRTMFFSSFLPGEVNRAVSVFTHASGKGLNAARTLKALGRKSVVLTHAGGALKSYYLTLAKDEALNVSSVSSRTDIRICTTVVEDGRTTEIVEESAKVTDKTQKKLIKKGLSLINKAELLMLSGKPAQGYEDTVFAEIFLAAKKKNIPVVADTRDAYLLPLIEEGGFFLKINRDEFISTFFKNTSPRSTSQTSTSPKNTGQENINPSQGEIEEKMLELYIRKKIKSFITDGKNDVAYISASGEIKRKKPPLISAVNTTGCGDAFSAALASAILDGRDTDSACEYAISVAACTAATMIPGGLR